MTKFKVKIKTEANYCGDECKYLEHNKYVRCGLFDETLSPADFNVQCLIRCPACINLEKNV